MTMTLIETIEAKASKKARVIGQQINRLNRFAKKFNEHGVGIDPLTIRDGFYAVHWTEGYPAGYSYMILDDLCVCKIHANLITVESFHEGQWEELWDKHFQTMEVEYNQLSQRIGEERWQEYYQQTVRKFSPLTPEFDVQ